MPLKNIQIQAKSFSSGFYDWIIFLINFYKRINQNLDIDFDSFIILQLVVSYNVYFINKSRYISIKELTFEFEKASQKSIKNNQKLTVTSISSALNIPRETVKRKVLGLQKKQLLEIGSNKSVYLGKYYAKIFSDFATGTTLDLSKLIQRWDKNESLEKLRYLKF